MADEKVGVDSDDDTRRFYDEDEYNKWSQYYDDDDGSPRLRRSIPERTSRKKRKNFSRKDNVRE